ncbi:MAG: hypothetical protein LBB46_05480 [Coriobacteriaceae bacterium]|jgi:hypothetical protein|nr:hypothetical protein [Coriobacteriaceae bacterium]
MKKSSFVAMIMGTVGGILFAVGMCMCLLPEWDAFKPGVVMGAVGALILVAAVIVWRRMTGKVPIRLNGKTAGIVALGIVGALLLGVGMCFAMVWENIVVGIVIGIVGVVLLLSLIPMVKGLE